MIAKADETKSYHHGDLREALIEAARRLMEERAHWTFTLREVARAAGVSHNAPYNHFEDRRALLAAVAARGFDDLTAALRACSARENAAARIRAVAGAYVGFAVRNGSSYRLMFSAELADCRDLAFLQSGERAFGVLRETIEQGVAEGALRVDAHATHAVTAWSLVHGVGTLILDGKLPRPEGDAALEAFTHIVAGTLLEGLRIR